MMKEFSFRNAFIVSIALHFALLLFMSMNSSNKRPALTKETQNTPGVEQAVTPPAHQPEVIKAVTVDSSEVMATVNRIKQERAQQQKAELNRQKELNRQVELAKQQRVKEQQQLAKLKEEANKIAIARKKQAEDDKKHLKEMAEQKALESKRIKELKEQKDKLVKQQVLEEKKLAQLNKIKVQEQEKAAQIKSDQAKADKAKAEKATAEKNRAEKEKQAQAMAAKAAAENAQNQARIMGEVDKYKALIVNAIGRNWILPEHADSGLSSQFRIRLAPDGMVLEVSLTRSSGNPLLDRSAQTAIYKASPLPVPTNAETFNLFRDINLTVRPEQARG